jgi:hypothetical protein
MSAAPDTSAGHETSATRDTGAAPDAGTTEETGAQDTSTTRDTGAAPDAGTTEETGAQDTSATRDTGAAAGMRSKIHAIAVAFYLFAAAYVTQNLWAPNQVTQSNEHDYAFFQFVLSHAAHNLFSSPFLAEQLNAPQGVNMMANTSMLGISVPLAPLTLLAGPQVSFLAALMIALAGTATAWYYFFLKHITANPWLAMIAGGFCGFSPAMISQSNAHPNIVAQFMVPLIISQVLRIKEDPKRRGVILGLMIVYQLFINEEILLYTALACAIIAVTVLVSQRTNVVPYLKALGIAAGISIVIMAYPLWFQFFGPQHYTGPFWWAKGYGIDLAAYTSYATLSLGGDPGVPDPVGSSLTEQNAFYGWPLCLLAIGLGIALWRHLAARVALVTGLILAALSLGSIIKVNNHQTAVPGPWALVSDLPLFDSIIVTRIAMQVAPAIAVILVIAAGRFAARSVTTAALSGALAAIALLPLVPAPLPSTDHAPVPAFFTTNAWRTYLKDGTFVPVPPDVWSNDSLHWLVATRMQARIADGYFIGPSSESNPVATFGPSARPTGHLLRRVAATGATVAVTEEIRRQFEADLVYWNADAFVLSQSRTHHRDQLLALLADLTGGVQATETGGVIVWDVHGRRVEAAQRQGTAQR